MDNKMRKKRAKKKLKKDKKANESGTNVSVSLNFPAEILTKL